MKHVIVTDPTPFLSTIAAVSATMVAIVGGLLVARFVTIDSEQEGAQQLLDDARGRLDTARKRAKEVVGALYTWDVNDFFEAKVIRAIGAGEHDVSALRDIGGGTRLTDEAIAYVVQEIVTEFDKARRILGELITNDTEHTDDPTWKEFWRSYPTLTETTWDDVWETVYEDLVRPPRPSNPLMGDLGFPETTMLPLITPPEYVALDVRRRDSLRGDVERAQQRAEDIEAEVAHLQRTREVIVRPKGLGWGLAVLSFFTVVGVIIPLWLMSRGPKRLTAHLGEVVFWLFLSGLLLLLGYMTVLALRLSRGNQSDPLLICGVSVLVPGL